MLVFDDSIDNCENSRKFWIKNTISTVKTKKLTSKNDTNLTNKIYTRQKNKNNIWSDNLIIDKKINIKSHDKIDRNSKNLNNIQYNNKPFYSNGEKQTKKTKKISC